MEENLGVGAGIKPVAETFEFLAQLGMIINFAIEGDCQAPVLSGHGLVARFNIDDFQSRRA